MKLKLLKLGGDADIYWH